MFLFTVVFALLLLGVCLRKGECCPIFSSGHRAVGTGETSLCLCNMIKELTPDLLGVGFFFFFFFAFVSSITWRLMLGGDVSEGQMKGSTEPLNLHQHHNGYS